MGKKKKWGKWFWVKRIVLIKYFFLRNCPKHKNCDIIALMTVINGKFEWDSEKDELNKIKHGFSFSEILDVFDDPYFIERYDTEHSTLEEDRFIGLGESGGAVIVMTAYTERERTRLISARFATESERKLYYDTRKNS